MSLTNFFSEALLAVGVAMLYYWVYSDWVKQKSTMPAMKKILAWTLILAAVFVLLAIFQEKGWIFLFGSNRMKLFFLTFDKKWMFDFLCIICFPSILILLSDAIKQENCVNNQIYAAIIIIAFTVMGIFLYEGENIYLFEMALLNLISVSSFARSICENSEKGHRAGTVIGISLLYLIFWIVLLYLLIKSDQIEFMRVYPHVIYNLSFGVEWIDVEVRIVLSAVFLHIMYCFWAPKFREYKMFYWIYQAAFMKLMFCIVVGTIYSFEIMPVSVELPFSGSIRLDSMCVALLIYSHIENSRIRPVLDVYSDVKLIHLSKLLKKYMEGSRYLIEEVGCDMDNEFVICSLKSLSQVQSAVSVIPIFECSMKEREYIICSTMEQTYREIVVLEKSNCAEAVSYLEADKETAEEIEGCYKSTIILSLKTRRSILDNAQTILSDVVWKKETGKER